jgi:uroporphyrinogen III methyltransferase/synthase
MTAEVSFIGAGPGDPGLITVRGLAAAQRAEAIIYDALVDPRLLRSLGTGERHAVGGRRKSDAQRMQRLAQLYRGFGERGLRVARVKGGDATLFARISEEIQLLEDLGVRYEIIPGVTAALGAAAYAQLPLTVRGKARSVALLTGHASLAAAPAADTLAIYMGAERCQQLCGELIEQGWATATPATAVANATLPQQQTTPATLGDFASGQNVPPAGPLLLVVGDVCTLAPRSSWYDRRRRILVTGTDASRYCAYGEVIHTPLIETVAPAQPTALVAAVAEIANYAWLVFTSRAAVAALLEQLLAAADARVLAGVRLAAIGSDTAAALRDYGLRPDLVPSRESSDDLGRALVAQRSSSPAERVLLPRSDLADATLPDTLRGAGFIVDSVDAYRTRLPAEPLVVDLGGVDAVAFASASTVHNFAVVYGAQFPAHAAAIVRGDATSRAVTQVLGKVPQLRVEELGPWAAQPRGR